MPRPPRLASLVRHIRPWIWAWLVVPSVTVTWAVWPTSAVTPLRSTWARPAPTRAGRRFGCGNRFTSARRSVGITRTNDNELARGMHERSLTFCALAFAVVAAVAGQVSLRTRLNLAFDWSVLCCQPTAAWLRQFMRFSRGHWARLTRHITSLLDSAN